MGYISLEGMEFYAHHGYYKDEITKGNKFVVDLRFETDLSSPAKSDELSEAMNYEEIYDAVKEQMAIRSNLLENVAYRIGDSLKDKFPQIKALELKISKLNPRLEGAVERVCIEVKR